MKYTPRTDEKNDELLDQDSYTSWLEMSQFARQLERELNAAKERIKRLEEAGTEIAKWIDRNTPHTVRNDWTAAKEAKP